MSNKPPKIGIPGLNRGTGVPAGYILGRGRNKGKGPAELLDLNQLQGQGIGTVAHTNRTNSSTASTAHSGIVSLSTSVSTSLSQVSSSLSAAISTTTSISTAISTVDSNQNTSLSQISSSLSTEISVDLSRINSLSTAIGLGVLPLVDGSVPPVFIQNPDGSLVFGKV